MATSIVVKYIRTSVGMHAKLHCHQSQMLSNLIVPLATYNGTTIIISNLIASSSSMMESVQIHNDHNSAHFHTRLLNFIHTGSVLLRIKRSFLIQLLNV